MRAAAPTEREAGARLGALFAANTAGGVLGALLAGFVLLPALGLDHAARVAAGAASHGNSGALPMWTGATTGGRGGWNHLLPKVEQTIELALRWLGSQTDAPTPDAPTDALAYRWRDRRLESLRHPDIYPLEELIGVEHSVARLRSNVAAFTQGQPALDTLLYGDRGTGKSSAVRGLLGEFSSMGLRLVEVQPDSLRDLYSIFGELREREERFALYCLSLIHI